MYIKGVVKKDRKTKKLTNRLEYGDIALIDHKDLDEVAALSLVEKKVKCVVNINETISGRYPNQGPSVLAEANIPLFQSNDDVFNRIDEGDIIEIIENKIISKGEKIADCELLDEKRIEELLNIGYANIESELESFIENTLEYAKKEKGLVTGKISIPKTKTKIKGRHVLVVVRGRDYKMDLEAIKSYIDEVKPILIGVDGGGDALLDFGYKPHIVVGDMDSVSDKCLKLAKEIIVHAYPDGRAPGLKRVEELGLKAQTFPAPGTSEDIAFLLAYANGADLIVAVGTHTNMIDFLEKGRSGMSSTFLVRLKVGSILVDAKGVNKLYHSTFKLKYVVGITIAALIPILVITFMHPLLKELLLLLKIRIRMMLGL
ncbi:putative membrane-anchored protein [[Clostridium] ultunense Esp]|uniref:Putative membrane-anchored protein n=1 Tax=[Clostridium] ultunense Esp TaxID=1288971 RepID=M1Z621_9FIRM|nr:putative cytokinetic ring protein SteA [Schnuerera ultunensis]CCQ93184.1 putative membrane-anchored protein [[Clostridium] ultunense Esp]SHD77148.1 putative membrane-anchored protein [[Clostridium] ultunense Esp]